MTDKWSQKAEFISYILALLMSNENPLSVPRSPQERTPCIQSKRRKNKRHSSPNYKDPMIGRPSWKRQWKRKGSKRVEKKEERKKINNSHHRNHPHFPRRNNFQQRHRRPRLRRSLPLPPRPHLRPPRRLLRVASSTQRPVLDLG